MRTVEQIKADMDQANSAYGELEAELERARGAERSAGLPADWREQLAAATIKALGETSYGGRTRLEFDNGVTLYVEARASDEDSDDEETEEEEAA